MTTFETSDRFLRPDDLRLIKRNRRQVQAERLLSVAGRVAFASLVVLLIWWIYGRTQQDRRFAVRSVEVSGVRHTAREDLTRITGAYVGLNLFKLDIARIQHDLRALPWVERVAIEKKLPSTLKISVVERQPVALASIDGVIRYVDQHGKSFADLSPKVGNPDLPLITNVRGVQIKDCVAFLVFMRTHHPPLYARISEVSPSENGLVVFDRDLRTRIFIPGADAASKWQSLYGFASAEGFRGAPPEYVDLRFADRVIVKPHRSLVVGPQSSGGGSTPMAAADDRRPGTDHRPPNTGAKS
jgi:hypothetical protein